MATLRIEYDYVKAKANVLAENASKIEKILNDLIDNVQTNINDRTWTGIAADDFKSEWNKASSEFTEFIQYLKSVQSKVETAGKEAEYYDQMQNK